MSEQRAASGEQPAEVEVDPTPAGVDPEEVVEEVAVSEDGEPAADASGPEPDPLTEALRERDEYLQLAQRARADFENFRRRATVQTAEAERRGKVSLAKGLLPALDNLERALLAAGIEAEPAVALSEEPPSQEVSARDALASGVALVLNELRVSLERSGVSSYDPVGERFDPVIHEAISTGQADGAEAGIVLETLERGYRVDEQVIRPARVVVAG